MIFHLNRICGICRGSCVEVEVVTPANGDPSFEQEITCRSCGGDGVRESNTICHELGDMLIHMDSEIHENLGLVTAHDEKLNDMDDKLNDALDNLNDIIEKLNE